MDDTQPQQTLLCRSAKAVSTHRASLLSICVRGFTVIAGFVIAFLIGNRFGAEALGIYALVTQTAMFLSIVAVGGLDLSIVKYFPVIAGKPAYKCRTVFALFLACSGICLAVTTLVLLFGNFYFSQFPEVPSDTLLLAVLGVIFVSRAFTRTTSAFLRSQRSYVYSQVVEGLLIPLPVIAFVLLGWAENVVDILLATASFGLLAITIGILSSFQKTTKSHNGLSAPIRGLFITALPLWAVAIIKNFGDWYALSIVGAELSVADAGLFRIAVQIATSLAIITVGLFGVFSPQISTAIAQDDPQAVARLARTATFLSLALAFPAIAILGGGADLILRLVGEEFVAARTPLLILLVGQFVYMVSGPSGILLALMGKQSVNLYIALAALLCLATTIPIAAKVYGLLGVAFALAAITSGQNIAIYLAVRRLLHIDIWSGRYFLARDQDR